MLNIDHHQVMAGGAASLAPGFENEEALAQSKRSPEYWASTTPRRPAGSESTVRRIGRRFRSPTLASFFSETLKTAELEHQAFVGNEMAGPRAKDLMSFAAEFGAHVHLGMLVEPRGQGRIELAVRVGLPSKAPSGSPSRSSNRVPTPTC